ncbi:phytase [Teredinibacter sp. KSP-S5-2]|uniref:phytase n=1 Tax=Teredinibacter sp. KSP-S5-2 TaxID=3034506 RepID=UPI0029340F02|nr:phytase [Teredinibacter sp. KSP-S5-2]WNO09119.1 phytase [Teredinibacter sp. KSP-S5-2]
MTALKKISVFFGALIISIYLFGCAKQDKSLSQPEVLNLTLLGEQHNINTVQEFTVNNKNYFIASSEQYGLLLLNNQGNLLANLKGKYEIIELVNITDFGNYAVTLDTELNTIKFIDVEVEPAKLTSANKIQPPKFIIDGFCTHVDQQRNLFLFLLDGYGGGENRWVFDTKRKNFTDLHVKQLNLPPKTDVCVTDTLSDTLYLMEENLGVWAYPANSESVLERTLVDINTEKGKLVGELASIAIAKENLFVLSGETNLITMYRKVNQQWAFWHRYQIPQEISASRISVNEQLDYLHISIVDKKGRIFHGKIQSPSGKTTEHASKEFGHVTALVETSAFSQWGDTADDPAIWINLKDAEKSLILGTNKKQGLYVYDFQGNEIQSLPIGDLNNVDLRQQVITSDGVLDIVAASNRSNNHISLFSIDPSTRKVYWLADAATTLNQVYGICMYKDKRDKAYVYINDKDGRYEQYALDIKDGQIESQLVRSFALNSQPEGCAVDDLTGTLFLGEEDKGLWYMDANFEQAAIPVLIEPVGSILVNDIEGVDVIHSDYGNYVVVSSQGDNSYALFNIEKPFIYRGSFKITPNGSKVIDGVAETDGLAASGWDFGGEFHQGVIVVQDGYNLMPQEPQNFKYVSWQSIAEELHLND